MKKIFSFIYILICIATAMIGYEIHRSIFYSIIDFFFCPLAWIYWLIGHDVTLSIIKQTFEFFIK